MQFGNKNTTKRGDAARSRDCYNAAFEAMQDDGFEPTDAMIALAFEAIFDLSNVDKTAAKSLIDTISRDLLDPTAAPMMDAVGTQSLRNQLRAAHVAKDKTRWPHLQLVTKSAAT